MEMEKEPRVNVLRQLVLITMLRDYVCVVRKDESSPTDVDSVLSFRCFVSVDRICVG